MSRLVPCVAAVLLASAARADVAPPPGQVRVPVDYVIQADKAYPEYVFVVMIGGSPDWSYKAALDKDKPIKIEGKNRGGRARLCWLAAVPAAAAREFKTDKELLAAVAGHKVKGVLVPKDVSFDSFTVVPAKDAPKVIEARLKIERITPEDGIVLSAEKVGLADPDPRGLGEESLFRWAVAGVMAALAVCGLGLWLAGRRRAG